MNNLGIAIYSYKGADRLECLLQSIKHLGHTNPIVVAEDRSDDATAARYANVCAEFGARHVRLETWGHMGGANHRAVMECNTRYVMALSDDVLIPRGLIAAIERFLSDNILRDECREFMGRLGAIMLHHWDRADIIKMSWRGEIPELSDFQEKDFWSGRSEWFWKHLDGRLPDGGWSEPTPPDKVGIVPSVHGSGYVVSRDWFERVGGTANIFCWQNDSTISLRLNNHSSAFIVRLPGLPSLAHYGGGAPVNADPTNLWTASVKNLCDEHGAHYRPLPDYRLPNGEPIPPIELLEIGGRLRAYSLQKKFADVIDRLDYSYLDDLNVSHSNDRR